MSNPIKPSLKTEIIPLILILISVIASFYFYSNFPERVPIHWNMAGEADNWSSSFFAAFFFPLLIVGIYLLFLFLPYLDPQRERYQQFLKVYHTFKAAIIFFMAAIYFVSSLNGLGYNVPTEIYVPVLVGLLFIIIGNYLSKVKYNWFVGIRTPWTLSSEEVWNKTHRFGGKIFILGGLLMAAESITPISLRMPLFMATLFLIIFGTIGYSYFLYSKEIRNKKDEQNQ